jgi:hypothetical protein
MNIKNIGILSFMGGLLLVFGSAIFIVDAMFVAPTLLIGCHIPEAISEIR